MTTFYCFSVREPARSKSQALTRYQRILQLALSCVAAQVQWYAAPPKYEDDIGLRMLTEPGVVRLRREDDTAVYFAASQVFTFRENEPEPGEFKVRTLKYIYSVTADERLSEELFDWHWHPTGTPAPHLHVNGSHDALGYFGAWHLPTARVSLESIIRMLIRDCGVRPARNDWAEVLDDCESRFLTYRTWATENRPEDYAESP